MKSQFSSIFDSTLQEEVPQPLISISLFFLAKTFSFMNLGKLGINSLLQSDVLCHYNRYIVTKSSNRLNLTVLELLDFYSSSFHCICKPGFCE